MSKFFCDISVSEQKKLLKILRTNVVLYEKNYQIPSLVSDDIMGLVISGEIEITKEDYNGNRIIIEELTEDKIIGNLTSTTYSDEYKIFTKTECSIIYIDHNNIINEDNTMYKCYNQFIKNLFVVTNEIIKEKNERIDILSNKSIRDKLLEYFKITANKSKSKIIYLPFSYTELANYLSVDRAALSREIGHLRDEGFVKTDGRKITLIEY
ncbi:MAG: Crp/Fnr family transcriptional regulator [bacterium]